jgi:hypothetical protein
MVASIAQYDGLGLNPTPGIASWPRFTGPKETRTPRDQDSHYSRRSSEPGNTGCTSGNCSGDNIDATFFDASANAPNVCVAGPPAIGGDKRPVQALTAFDGRPLTGTWTLNVADRAGIDTGTIDSVCLELPAGSPDGLFANGFE